MRLQRSYRPLAGCVRKYGCGIPATGVSRWLGWRSVSSQVPPPRASSKFRWPYPLGVSLALIPGLYYLFTPSPPELSPYTYSDHPVSSTIKLSAQHALITVDIPESRSLSTEAHRRDGTPVDSIGGEIAVVHCMIGNPFIQIERPYTPINDPAEGKLQMVVKRVKGGEVGRLVHSLKEGSDIGLRGPITTFTVNPKDYDQIIMISTGTGIAPFLQLLSKVSSLDTATQYRLIHALPLPQKEDWAVTSGILPSVQESLGDKLVVDRIPAGLISREAISKALASTSDAKERVMVLVCLPPMLLKPLCGTMTQDLQQGPLTGVLADLGLRPDQVLKLE